MGPGEVLHEGSWKAHELLRAIVPDGMVTNRIVEQRKEVPVSKRMNVQSIASFSKSVTLFRFLFLGATPAAIECASGAVTDGGVSWTNDAIPRPGCGLHAPGGGLYTSGCGLHAPGRGFHTSSCGLHAAAVSPSGRGLNIPGRGASFRS